MSGILFKSFCYATETDLKSAVMSSGIYDTPAGPGFPSAVVVGADNDNHIELVQMYIEGTGTDNNTGVTTDINYSLLASLPYCDYPGYATGSNTTSTSQNVDPVTAIESFTAGAFIVFPAFAIAWAAAFVVNSIRGKF